MLIALDARPLLNPMNGIGRYTIELVRHMSSMGHQWLLYSPSPIETELEAHINVKLRSGVGHKSLAANAITAQMSYRRWLEEDRPDVFWSPRHHLPLFPRSHIPQVVTIHDLLWKRHPETMPKGAALLEQALMPPAVKKATSIICVSGFTAGELFAFWPQAKSKTHVVLSSGFSQKRLATSPAKGDFRFPYILFVGTPEPRKNLPTLLTAFAKLKAAHHLPEKLIVVGANGWGLESIEHQLASLSLSGDVLIKENVAECELQSLYQHARCLVFPSLYEGFGLPVVEAMQNALPAIVSRGGALEEIAGNSALLCDPHSIDDIYNSMWQLLSNKALHEQLSDYAVQRAQNFSWEKAATQTLSILEQAALKPKI